MRKKSISEKIPAFLAALFIVISGGMPGAQAHTADTDGDGIYDDGDGSGTAGDTPCTGGNSAACDDNCIDHSNPDQADTDSDGSGDVCDACPLSRPLKTGGTYFTGIQQAYDAAGDGDLILSQYILFPGNLNIDGHKSVELKGGYDCAYHEPPEGITALNGQIHISDGTFTMNSGKVYTAHGAVITIMPIGDSITRGGGYPIGAIDFPTYRYYLYNALSDDGWLVNYVGPYNGVGDDFNTPSINPYIPAPPYQDQGRPVFPDQDLAGSTGSTIDQFLAEKLPADNLMVDYHPDIVLVHLGTNDLGGRSDTPEEAAADIGQLIDLIRAGSVNVKIFVAQIIPLLDNAYGYGPGEYQAVQEFNALLPALISQKNQSAGYPPVTLVDMWNGFDPDTMLAEATHPNDAGDREMAVRWYNAIRSLY